MRVGGICCQEETTAGYGESPPSEADGHTSKTLECPHALVGYLIGKKGVMIKRIKVSGGGVGGGGGGGGGGGDCSDGGDGGGWCWC